MKIAVISDIHGNLPALQAVTAHIETWQPDIVVVNGDIVNRGPLSLDCLRFVQKKQSSHNWQVVRGNHEDYLLDCARLNIHLSGPAFEIVRFAHWAYRQLDGEVSALAAMPYQYTWLAPDKSEFRVVHASMRNNRDGIYVDSPDDELRQQIAPLPAVFVTGHTHQPLIRRLDNALVVNVGSVGAPFDEDNRASYGQFTWSPFTSGWRTRIVRLAYDRQQTERDYVTSGFLTEGGPLAQLMLVELRKARGLVFRWASRYQEAVLAGAVTMEESVRQVLRDEDLRPFLGPPGWVL
jgi:predicted phosphodiesterase